MNKITFNNVLPAVFKGQQMQSEIWQTETCFEKGKLSLVIADSGKGKSTFCSYVLGYRSDYEGSILFDTEDVKGFSVEKWCALRRTTISHLFQELRLFPELTALENVQIKNLLTGHKSETEILDWFKRLGIEDKVNTKVAHMSFGQQQRVAMMRALVQPFDFLLLDEPISHLDDTNSAIMADIMMAEVKRQGAGVIVTSIGKHMELEYDRVVKL
jgi:ABC-type lipoprotein export system ATPase subunit